MRLRAGRILGWQKFMLPVLGGCAAATLLELAPAPAGARIIAAHLRWNVGGSDFADVVFR